MKPKFILFASIGATLVSILFYSLTAIFGFNKTPIRTYLLSKDYSRLDRSQVLTRIPQDFTLPSQLTLHYQDQVFSLNTASISAHIDPQSTANSLLTPHTTSGVAPFLEYLFSEKKFPLSVSVNQSQLNQYLDQLAFQVQKPFVPTQLLVTGSSLEIKPGQLGLNLDSSQLKELIIHRLSYADPDPINLPISPIGQLPTPDQIEQTKTKAEKLLGKSLLLTGEFEHTPVVDSTLISWLLFDGSYDPDKINQYTQNFSQSVRRSPIDAIFNFQNNLVTEFRPAQNGLEVDHAQLVSILPQHIDQLADSSSQQITLSVPVKIIDPLLRTQDANNLGIKELLGTGISTFSHSSTIRNFNIQKGASIVNRILVPPGEEFSFLHHLGDVTLEAGYKKAYIIRQGRTELDVGGGICQVSTTLFRAMLDAGLDITARRPHAFRVSYYEEDSPPGFDATVFIPSPDLKFKNDTGHHLLIQNTYDDKNKRLTYEIYGTSDNRQAEISNYRKWDYAPPPPTRYIDDPTLEPGKLVQEETAVPGLKVAFDWKVTRDGQVLHQQTFQSNYVPWAAVFRRGI